MKTVAFVPLKLNNERLPGKNTKCFRGGKPLFRYILETLSEVALIDEVYVFCSASPTDFDLPEDVRYLRRSESLDRDTTTINEVMLAFADEIDADVYVLAHATAPFLEPTSVSRIVEEVHSGRHDSAMSVQGMREFCWRDGAAINYDPKSIPRTQDLDPIYVETSGVYAYTERVLRTGGRRVGDNPALIEVTRIESTDIDEPLDFVIAEALYQAGLTRFRP